MHPPRSLLLLPPLAALAQACSSAAPATHTAAPDSGVAADAEPASADASADAAVALDSGPRPIPLAPERAAEPVRIERWIYAVVPNPASSDPVRAALESGAFSLPQVGDAFGVRWLEARSGPNGELQNPVRGYIYAAAEVETSTSAYLFARADRVLGVYTNGVLQPGDVYGSGGIRVPLTTEAGTNLIVVQGYAGRGAPLFQLWNTQDEVVFNLNDITGPELVAGAAYEQHVGVPILNLGSAPALDFSARVEDSSSFEATEIRYPSLGGGAATQISFRLTPKHPFDAAGAEITVGLRVESRSLRWSYRRELTLRTVARGTPYRRTLRSAIDGSTQYYGVVPPASFTSTNTYGLILALHGASVDAIGHARAYAPKSWAYVIAPTNRRPFGFDWEAWGRLDAMEVLDVAERTFHTRAERTYVAGHSMGGHGTWQLGVLFPGRFAVAGPSAGWSSFETYTGTRPPAGALGRAQASSTTNNYLSNLSRRGVYILHGSADDNVPVREARNMYAAVRMISNDVVYHEEPGVGHWWDRHMSPGGVDCVDWVPMMSFIRAHFFDPTELVFGFTTPSPVVSSKHSYLTILSESDAYRDIAVTSTRSGSTVEVTTSNVRTMLADGMVLREKGISRLIVDGRPYEVTAQPIAIGPQDGKRPGVHGPLDEVFYRPFCFVYPDDGPVAYRRYAAFLLSNWAFIGNGEGCALPLSELSEAVRDRYNLIYLGIPKSSLGAPAISFDWDEGSIALESQRFDHSALAFVFPERGHLSAVFATTAGDESLLFQIQPFTSHLALPDYFVWSRAGGRAAGFFEPDWRYTPGR